MQKSDVTQEQKERLRQLLLTYNVGRGWHRISIVLGYLVGLGLTGDQANDLAGDLVRTDEFRRVER